MTLHQIYLGVDVAKDWIDVFDPTSNTARRIAMAARALKAVSAGLSGAVLVFAASGGYERPHERQLRMPRSARNARPSKHASGLANGPA